MATVKTRKLLLLALAACWLGLGATPLKAQDLLHLARQVTGGHSLHPSKYPQLAQLARELERQANSEAPATDDAILASHGIYGESKAVPLSNDQWAILEKSMPQKATGIDCRIDPSDPTSTACHVLYEWSWQSLAEQQGEWLAFKINPRIPIELCGQTFLAQANIPVQAHTDLLAQGGNTGFGDVRMKLGWLVPLQRRRLCSVLPSLEAIAPTGDPNIGLGGGNWLYMPGLLLSCKPAQNLALYPTFRYLHGDQIASGFVPELPGLPVAPGGFNSRVDVRGFQAEIPIVFQLNRAVIDWVSITPDIYQSLDSNGVATLTMKYETGIKLSQKWYLISEAWHAVSSNAHSDFNFNLKLDWYPLAKKGPRRGFAERLRLR